MTKDVVVKAVSGAVLVTVNAYLEGGSEEAEWSVGDCVPEFVGTFMVHNLCGVTFVNKKAKTSLSKWVELSAFFKSRGMSIWQA